MKTLVLDTSPLLSLYLGEPTAAWVGQQLDAAERHLMSTVNLTECLIVLRQRGPAQVDALEQRLLASSIEFVPPDAAQAIVAARARSQFPLNLGDCFAYALAKTQQLPLLTLDRDFRGVDVPVILPPDGR
ncbi:MAG: type II toxin-antitoxin system VapC family toxin, partial [Planctomycetota bacterium]|nr:type II toxin-antitoxin system VapC family toxin [Planctomycetota bacterium]